MLLYMLHVVNAHVTCLTSWKKADKRNTAACDVTLEYPLVISGV